MTTTKTRQELLNEIETEIRDIMHADLRNGANDYAYVRVAADGSVYSGREASYCVGMDEWEGKPPHTVTVWSANGMRGSAGRDDGVFIWEEVETIPEGVNCWEDRGEVFVGDPDGDEPIRKIEDCFLAGRVVNRLTDDMVEVIDLTDLLSEIDDQIDEYEWLPVRD